MKKHNILIIINLTTFFAFIFSIYTYKSRVEIMKTKNAISNYEIVNYHCNKGSRNHSTIEISYNSKEYYVSLNYNICKDLKNNNTKLKLYYDNALDIVFYESGLNKKIVIGFGCGFIFFLFFWFIPKKYW